MPDAGNVRTVRRARSRASRPSPLRGMRVRSDRVMKVAAESREQCRSRRLKLPPVKRTDALSALFHDCPDEVVDQGFGRTAVIYP